MSEKNRIAKTERRWWTRNEMEQFEAARSFVPAGPFAADSHGISGPFSVVICVSGLKDGDWKGLSLALNQSWREGYRAALLSLGAKETS